VKYITDIQAVSQKKHIKYLPELRELSRQNRNNPTQAEFIMWQHLRKNNFAYKFTRQKPIGRCILDFYCSKLLLAIEIDGSSHKIKENQDLNRDKALLNLNIATIRFTNQEILNNFPAVKLKYFSP
jgi:very-short-patch-repair endonuclease